MDKTELERQYRKGVISYHEYLIKLWFLEGKITSEEHDAILADIAKCFEDHELMLQRMTKG
jgi:hypothetical protein